MSASTTNLVVQLAAVRFEVHHRQLFRCAQVAVYMAWHQTTTYCVCDAAFPL